MPVPDILWEACLEGKERRGEEAGRGLCPSQEGRKENYSLLMVMTYEGRPSDDDMGPNPNSQRAIPREEKEAS